jgi:hypothetical protein
MFLVQQVVNVDVAIAITVQRPGWLSKLKSLPPSHFLIPSAPIIATGFAF